MSNEPSFARVAVLVTSFKHTPSGRTRAVPGSFRHVHVEQIAFEPREPARSVRGRIVIDLASFSTDAIERDNNVVSHLFGETRNVVVTIEESGQSLRSVGDGEWLWRGIAVLSLGNRLPLVLAIRRQRVGDRQQISARLARPIDMSVASFGFPFAAFVDALGVGAVMDRVEVDVGVVFDESAARPRVRVLVAGGGIAGLAAAQSLVDAGCDVTVLEKERFCGGKLTSHVDDALGHTVEHGIHGVFPPYRNLVALWAEAGIDESIFADTSSLGVASPEGMTSENFHQFAGLPPLFLHEMLPDGLMRPRDFAAAGAFLSRVYGAADDLDLLDRETFQSLLDRYGVSERLQQYLMHPYVRNLSYARSDQVSAAAACDALGYYLLENADNFKARWLDGGPQELVIDPWVAELQKRGVRFLTSTPVKFVLFEDGRFQGFATRAVISGRRLGSEERCWTQRFGARVLALRWLPEHGELRAWDGLCTHAGCPLQPAGERGCKGFRCDCHGGAFDKDGRVIQAPPTRDLPPLPVYREEISGEVFFKIALDEGGDGDGILSADYGIVALDIEGARKVLTPALLDLPSTGGIPALRTTPLMVLRMWFRGNRYAGPDSGFFQSSDLLDNFFVLSRFQREFREVAGFTVVECHIGDCASVEMRDDDDVLLEAARCLARYFPELGPDAIDVERSRVLRHKEGFSLFAPGDNARVPEVAAEDRPNLMFAGDWVKPASRSWFMERAAVSGIEAANRILASEGYARRPLANADSPNVVPKLIGLPFRASDALRRAYRAMIDGTEAFPSERHLRAAPASDPKLARQSSPKLVEAPASDPTAFVPPLLDLAQLLPASELERIHPNVRAFYNDPRAFDMTARLAITPMAKMMAVKGLPVSPLYALGLVGRKGNASRHEFAVRSRLERAPDGSLRWDRFVIIDGSEVPLFTGQIGAAEGLMRETLDGHGVRVTVDFRARGAGEGLRFELVKATPAWIFAPVKIRYETVPTAHGIRTTGSYRHRLLRIDGEIEFDARRRTLMPPRAEQPSEPELPITGIMSRAATSHTRLRPSSVPPAIGDDDTIGRQWRG